MPVLTFKLERAIIILPCFFQKQCNLSVLTFAIKSSHDLWWPKCRERCSEGWFLHSHLLWNCCSTSWIFLTQLFACCREYFKLMYCHMTTVHADKGQHGMTTCASHSPQASSDEDVSSLSITSKILFCLQFSNGLRKQPASCQLHFLFYEMSTIFCHGKLR